LLRIVCSGDQVGLQNLRRICSLDATLEVVIGLDAGRDRSEIKRLGLSSELVDSEIGAHYLKAGFEIIQQGVLEQSEWPKLQTSWAKRLKGNRARKLVYIIARAI